MPSVSLNVTSKTVYSCSLLSSMHIAYSSLISRSYLQVTLQEIRLCLILIHVPLQRSKHVLWLVPRLLRPCNSQFIRDNCSSKRRSPSRRYPRHARASSSEPYQATCSCDSEEEEALVKRHRRKSAKRYEHSPRSTEARSQLDCCESRTGILRRLLEVVHSRRPATDGRPPFVIRKVGLAFTS